MLNIKNLSYSYHQEQNAVESISIKLNSDEVLCLLGESGSGKSTLLKLIYGNLQPDEGIILFNDEKLKGPAFQLIAGHPDVKFVQQDFNLSPFISIEENIGEHLSNLDLDYKKKRIKEVAEILEIQDLLQKQSHELSGGQQQRVAIAKAIAKFPKLLLLDEPFSQLDANLHLKIRHQLMEYLKEHRVACIFTSHRAEDALGFSDQILILRKGKAIQNSTPQKIFASPANAYVASLFGNYNILTAEDASKFGIPRNFLNKYVISYPHEIKVYREGKFQGEVIHSRFFGKEYQIEFIAKNHFFYALHPDYFKKGEKINFDIKNYRWVY